MEVKRFRDSLFHISETQRGVDASAHTIEKSDYNTVPLPAGALAFESSTTTHLPTRITVRGRVNAGGHATVWLAHTFRISSPVTVHYFAPLREMRRPPAYRAGIMYPPRTMVEHRGGVYQNGQNCDVHSRPTNEKDWVYLGNIQDVIHTANPWIVSDAIGFVVNTTDQSSPHIVECSTPAPLSPTPVAEVHGLMHEYTHDETYSFAFKDPVDAPTDVTVVWTMHNKAEERIAVLLPAMCSGENHECKVNVHIATAGRDTLRQDHQVGVDLSQLRRRLQLPRIQVGGQVLWHHAPLQAYCAAAPANLRLRSVSTDEVHKQLGGELFDTMQVRVLSPSPGRQSLGVGQGTESSCFTWKLRARGAMVRTELHLRYTLPAPPPCFCLRLIMPHHLTLTQFCFEKIEGDRLLVRHGRVLGTNWVTQDITRGSTTHPEEWYSYATSYECLKFVSQDAHLILWVVHAQDDREPITQWVSETWTEKELAAQTDPATEEDEDPAIPCHTHISSQRRARRHHATTAQVSSY